MHKEKGVVCGAKESSYVFYLFIIIYELKVISFTFRDFIGQLTGFPFSLYRAVENV